jgi:hypothetical protein
LLRGVNNPGGKKAAMAELREVVTSLGQQVRAKGSRDQARVRGRTVYLQTPDGYPRSERVRRCSGWSAPRPLPPGVGKPAGLMQPFHLRRITRVTARDVTGAAHRHDARS